MKLYATQITSNINLIGHSPVEPYSCIKLRFVLKHQVKDITKLQLPGGRLDLS